MPGERIEQRGLSFADRVSRMLGGENLADIAKETGRYIRENSRTKEELRFWRAAMMGLRVQNWNAYIREMDYGNSLEQGAAHIAQWENFERNNLSTVIFRSSEEDEPDPNDTGGDDLNSGWQRLPAEIRAIVGGGVGGVLATSVLLALWELRKRVKRNQADNPQPRSLDNQRGSRFSRRQFLQLAGTGLLGAAVGCKAAGAGSQSTATESVPPTATPSGSPGLPTPSAEVTKNPETPNYNRLDAKRLDPWFRALALKVGQTDDRNIRSPNSDIPIVATRTTENSIRLNDLGLEFTPDHVRVNLPFDGDPTNTGVYAHGMAWLPYPYDKVRLPTGRDIENRTLTQLTQFYGLTPDQLRFDGTASSGNLQGHSERWSIYKDAKHQGYIVSPWLTGEKYIAEYMTDKGKSEIVYYATNGEGAKGKEAFRVPFEQVTVKLARDEDKSIEEVLTVTRDGRYMISTRKFDSAGNTVSIVPLELLSARLVSQNKLPAEVAKIYDDLFSPHITAGDWASFKDKDPGYNEKVKGNVNPEKMFEVTGCVNNAHKSTLDLEFGTMRLAVNTGQVITAENHMLERVRVANALETNKGFTEQLKAIRAQMLQKYKEIDFRNFTLMVDKGKVIQAVYRKGDVIERYAVKQNADGLALEKIEYFALLPKLKVNGAYIERADNVEEERKVLFKGANINTFLGGTQRFEDAKNYIDVLRKAGGNCIRILVDMGKVNRTELDKTIAYAEKNGFYVMIAPWGKYGSGINSPTMETRDFIVGMADRYKEYNHIFYEPLNEVADIQDETWYSDILRDISEIRSKNPDALIFLPSVKYNRDFSIYQRKPLNLPNIGFDIHYYKVQTRNGSDITAQTVNFQWILGRYPAIFSEAGVPFGAGGKNNPDDGVYIRKALDLVKQYSSMAHWLAFEMAPPNWGTSIMSSPDTIGGSRGTPYDEDLKNPSSPPPYNFRR